MKQETNSKKAEDLLSMPNQDSAEEFRFVRPFYIIVLLMLTFVYVNSVSQQPELRTWPRFFVFTLLMVLHGGLHWRSIILIQRPGWAMYYVVVQSIIALAIVFMLQELGLAFGVIAALIGEVVGIFRKRRKLAILTVFFLVIGMFGVLQIAGRPTPSVIWLTVIPLILFVIVYVELYSRQAEAREQAQKLLKELEIAHHELGLYADQVEELTLNQERQRMAYELHDTLGQGVAGLVLQLEAVKSHLESDRADRAKEIVTQALKRARQTLEESRAVIDDLQGIIREQVPFLEMIAQQSKTFSQSGGKLVDLQIDLTPQDLKIPRYMVYHLEKIISEALFNIIRYAQADHVIVRALGTLNELTLEISDDGVGFDTENMERNGKYGLLGIHDRARQLGGICEIQSQPGGGTLVKVVVPLENQGIRS